MSTQISPISNGTRLKKLTHRRVRFVVYLPADEAQHIDRLSNESGQSQSNIIAQYYYKGKNQQFTQKD